MEAGGDEGFKKDERSPEGDPHMQKEFCCFSKRMKEILFAIIATVFGAFAVQGVEMMVTNAKETLKFGPIFAGLKKKLINFLSGHHWYQGYKTIMLQFMNLSFILVFVDCKMPKTKLNNGFLFCPDVKNYKGNCYLQCDSGLRLKIICCFCFRWDQLS